MHKATPSGVECRGELVHAWFGNVDIHLTHEEAIDLSVKLRDAGRAAKNLMEVKTTRWNVVGVLTRKTDTVKAGDRVRNYSVHQNGRLVNFKFNHITMELGHEDAITLGNWLRIRGKEAARNSQDLRHWAEIAHG